MALITAHRVQTLSVIDIDDIQKDSDSIQIKISHKIKTTRLNARQPLLHVSFFQIILGYVWYGYWNHLGKKPRGSSDLRVVSCSCLIGGHFGQPRLRL